MSVVIIKLRYFIAASCIYCILLSASVKGREPNSLSFDSLCPNPVSSRRGRNDSSGENIEEKTALLPLPYYQKTVFPCKLRIEERNEENKHINQYQSAVIHYINVTSTPEILTGEEFKPCKEIILLKPVVNESYCNFPRYSVFPKSRAHYAFWSHPNSAGEKFVYLSLENYDQIRSEVTATQESDVDPRIINEVYVQMYMSINSENGAICRVQQYEVQFPSTSCTSYDYKLRHYCADFNCNILHSGKYQSMYNTTADNGKLFNLSQDELGRIIFATVCPILIVSILILAIWIMVGCRDSKRVSKSKVALTMEDEVVNRKPRYSMTSQNIRIQS